jgi:extradiol dioxygenase family protein
MVGGVAIQFNHTIVHARDREEEATFFTEVMGLPAARPLGHFLVVDLEHDASIDFAATGGEVVGQHYAFLVTEDDFTDIYDRIAAWGIEHWADPQAMRPGEINHQDGGRGVYFQSPAGHFLEIITRPYGSGS